MVFKSLLIFAASAVLGVHSSAVLSARQSPPTLPAGWTAIGCYSDNTNARTLKVAAFTDVTGMTIEECLAFCTPAAYKYAGVEFARECYCDNVIESPGVLENDGLCNMPCTGNSAEICGGASRINIFQSSGSITTTTSASSTSTTSSTTTTTTTTTTSTTSAPTPTIKRNVGTFQYKGCFEDAVVTTFRTLGTGVTVPGGVNAEGCTAACKAAGFPLAGLEFGQECWCDSFMEIVNLRLDSECNKPCVADATELCGAGNRLAVYEDTSATPPNPQQCLSNFQLPLIDFTLQAVLWPTGSSPIPLAGELTIVGEDSSTPQLYILTEDVGGIGTVQPIFLGNTANVSLNDLWLDSPSIGVIASLAPVVGGGQFFLTDPIGSIFHEPYDQYCAKPNPLGDFGPFIGPAILTINGQFDQWALCTNTTASGRVDVVYSPVANSPDYALSGCRSVLLQIQT